MQRSFKSLAPALRGMTLARTTTMNVSSCLGRGGVVRSSLQYLEVGRGPSPRLLAARDTHLSTGGVRSGFRSPRNVALFFKNTSIADPPASDAIPETSPVGAEPGTWMIRLLFDGDCPLCMREVDMLKNRDAGVGNIDFVDISSPDYRAEDNAGVTYEEAMGHIHGILPDGSVVTNIEVFRRCYEAVGLGWVYAVTKYEPIRKAADAVYGVWANYRLPLTGRPDLSMVLEKRRDQIDEVGCGGDDAETCELPWVTEEANNKN
ncbi:hypothetical protein BSKO_07851 [Bryopsis sp. KO-2023]|nr:hypothetical protein BSKO_07851 [Bryopsis sp. KO-2023]